VTHDRPRSGIVVGVRYVIYGAGAIGGTIGARLHQAGLPVVLVARGPHLEALRRDGLLLQTPDEVVRLDVPAAGSPAEAAIAADDVVLLTMKTQDTAAALDELRGAGDPPAAIVCAQNGVENERLALRRFADVYGMCVYLPSQHIEPGVVQAFAPPSFGVLDLGRVPAGLDERAQAIARDLRAAAFACEAKADIMRWKYDKLLANLGNGLQVLFGRSAHGGEWHTRAREEALACYAAHGIASASEAEVRDRRTALPPVRPVPGVDYGGGSTWQSVVRGTGSTEVDYLNGEIVLLGRLAGVPTPVNEAIVAWASRVARERRPPGSVDPERFARDVDGQGTSTILPRV